MVLFDNIILLYSLYYSATPFKSADLSNSLSMSWNQILPSTKLNHRPGNIRKPLHDILIGKNSHSLALLRWNDTMEKHPTAYNLTVLVHSFDGKVETKTCDVNPLTDDQNEWNFANEVTFLRHDRVLVTWKERKKQEEPRMKSCVIMMDTCQSSEPILFQSNDQFTVPFKNHFDIMVYNEKRCSLLHYCKMSFDLNGKPKDKIPTKVTKPYLNNDEFMTISKVYPIAYNSKEGMVLIGEKDQNIHQSTSPELYSPITGWSELDNVADKQHRYSNSSGFASICWFTQQNKEINCKWIDDAHVNGHILSLNLKKELYKLPWISNTPDGHILLMKSGEPEGKKLFVDKAHISGKCGRIMEIDVPVKPKKCILSITNGNKYCFSLIFTIDNRGNSKELTHVFVTKCVQMPETIFEDPISQCGKNYED